MICLWKSCSKTTRNKRTDKCNYLITFISSLKTWSAVDNVKQAYTFHVIVVGIPSSLIMFVKNRGWGGGGSGVAKVIG